VNECAMRLVLFATLLFAAVSAGPSTTALAQASEAELLFWSSIQESTDPAEFRTYLEAFPNGLFAPLARVRINQLESAARTSAAPTVSDEEEPSTVITKSGRAEAPRVGVESDIGYLGVQHMALTPTEARSAGLGVPLGVRIVALVDGGPADRAGLRVDDIVLKAGDFPVATMQGFVDILKNMEPGSEVNFEIIRAGRKRTIEVTIGGFLADNLAAARQGDTVAMRFLSDLYATGRLGEVDPEAALQWLEKAVESGDAIATTRLASHYWDGDIVAQDRDRSISLFEQAADLGDTSALATLGSIYNGDQFGAADPAKALGYYRRAGEAGNAGVYHRLGEMYADGVGTAKNVVEAIRWYRKAAEDNNVDSIISLAILFHLGKEVAQNYPEAARLYQRVLDLGADDGSRICYNYSLLYAHGNGVAKDERKAVDLLYRAIRASDSFAIDQFTTDPGNWSREFRRMLQTRLKQDGFYDGNIDGSFGPKSRRAIELAAQAGPLPATAAADGGAVRDGAASGLGLGRLEDFSTLD